MVPNWSPRRTDGTQKVSKSVELVPDGAEESTAFGVEVTKGSAQVPEGAQEVAKGTAKVPQKAAGGSFSTGEGFKGSKVVSIGTLEANKGPSKVTKGAPLTSAVQTRLKHCRRRFPLLTKLPTNRHAVASR